MNCPLSFSLYTQLHTPSPCRISIHIIFVYSKTRQCPLPSSLQKSYGQRGSKQQSKAICVVGTNTNCCAGRSCHSLCAAPSETDHSKQKLTSLWLQWHTDCYRLSPASNFSSFPRERVRPRLTDVVIKIQLLVIRGFTSISPQFSKKFISFSCPMNQELK